MLRTISGTLGILSLVPGTAAAQQELARDREEDRTSAVTDVPSEILAVRVEGPAPVVDGRLDDEAWQGVPAITQFLQRNPVEGAVPSESTEVRFVYTDRSLYVAFRGYDREPKKVYGRLMRRDQRAAADGFSIFIDSFYDRRTSFEISINPSGTRRDVFLYNDGFGQDDSWDPVYDWATTVDSLGWTVELRIPFSQLRFPPREDVVFGVRLRRYINRRNEDLNWPFFRRDQVGEASQYADLVGIADLPAQRRVELLPYTAGSTQFEPAIVGDPFATGRQSTARFGADLKLGITSGVTLELTGNPDFGQVEADAAEVNLSAFETFFPEKRPFFVEGTNLFQFGLSPAVRTRFGFARGGQEGLVFTRRIGRSPHVSPDAAGGYADQIGQTTILGAAKLTGQLPGGWALGVLQAVTAKEQVHIVDSVGVDGRSPVEPATSYTAIRIQRNTLRGRLAYGAIGTAAVRRLDEAAFDGLHERAVSGGADLNLRFGRDRYELGTAVMGSRVDGSETALLRTQLSSTHYFQRPDQTYATVDSSRTVLNGYAGHLRIAKVVGFLTWEARAATRSPGFEVNDFGFLRRTDLHEQRAQVSLRWLTPGRVFRQFTWQVQEDAEFSYGWERTKTSLQTRLDGDFLNYWNFNLTVAREFPSLSTRLLRGGPALLEPASWRGSLRGRTDWRRPFWLSWGGTYRTEESSKARTWTADGSVNLRPPGPFSMSLRGRANWATSDRQYLTRRSVGDSTYYVFGRLDRREVSLTLRADLAITPRLSFEFYAQPFVSAGTYESLKLVADPRADGYVGRFDPLEQDRLTRPGDGADVEVDVDRDGEADFTLSEPDFRVVSLRTNAVLRWEFRPGSTLFLVWQQDRRDRVADGTLNISDAFADTFTAEGTQVLAVKVAYWLGS